ncbi:flagellar biosynthesis regulator FlaF [Asaia astilbis]|uniref:flagellar biosynthesis regulator FlaF n=1 Tax=Asaia astilbis TaxID=610244 RepID=UPI00046F2518|nr:flagellar biosynthesis regulator FlaF [Asaia astilbis]
MHPALKAYQAVSDTSLSGREAEAACFIMMIDELNSAESNGGEVLRLRALDRHQKLWSLIMKANILDGGKNGSDDRALIVNLADQAQRYGIRAILDPSLTLLPLVDICQDVLDGLLEEATS